MLFSSSSVTNSFGISFAKKFVIIVTVRHGCCTVVCFGIHGSIVGALFLNNNQSISPGCSILSISDRDVLRLYDKASADVLVVDA